MAKKRTFKQQLFNAIDTRYKFGYGRQKHQDKKNGTNKNHDIIYCQSEHENLKTFVSEMDSWIKENYPEIHRNPIAEFPIEIAEEFLATKKETCSQKTIDAYKGRIQKAFRCAGATYKTADFSFIEDLRAPLSDRSEEATLRDVCIGRNLLEKALDNMQKDSGGWRGNKIASMFGARVKEIVKIEVRDVDFKNNTLTIVHGKGKKKRVLEMNEQQRQVMWNMCKDRKPGARIVGAGEDAIQKALTRALERIDKKEGTSFAVELKEKKTNTHAVRKLIGTERYKKNLWNEYWNAIDIKIKDEILAQQSGESPSKFVGGKNLIGLNQNQINMLIKNNLKFFISQFDKYEKRHFENKAWSEVSIFLGHGPDRWELKQVYVITDKTKVIDIK